MANRLQDIREHVFLHHFADPSQWAADLDALADLDETQIEALVKEDVQ